jgi:hypothetical protein
MVTNEQMSKACRSILMSTGSTGKIGEVEIETRELVLVRIDRCCNGGIAAFAAYDLVGIDTGLEHDGMYGLR